MFRDQTMQYDGSDLADQIMPSAVPVRAGGQTSHVAKTAMTTSAGSLGAFVSEPADACKGAAPLLLLHGISRDAEALFEAFLPAANAAGRVVIAPEFTKETWRVFQRITAKTRPDIALLELLTFLRATSVIDSAPVEVFGFSGGAQLGHRFAMLYPHMISSLHISSAGWYTLPRSDIPYPYGLSAEGAEVKDLIWQRRMLQGLDAFLRLPISIYVGSLDNQQEDPTLRRNDVLDASQGADRLTRARSYQDAIEAAAKERGVTASVRFNELAGCGHDAIQCIETGGLIDRILP